MDACFQTLSVVCCRQCVVVHSGCTVKALPLTWVKWIFAGHNCMCAQSVYTWWERGMLKQMFHIAIHNCLTATLDRFHHSNRTSGPYFLHSLTLANESSSIPLVSFAQYKQLGKLLLSCRRDAVLCLKARSLLPKEPYLHTWDIHLPMILGYLCHLLTKVVTKLTSHETVYGLSVCSFNKPFFFHIL